MCSTYDITSAINSVFQLENQLIRQGNETLVNVI